MYMKNFMKFIAIFILFFQFAANSFAGSNFSYKVEDLIIDNSDKVVFVKAKGNLTKKVKAFTITPPNRFVVDIEDAGLIGSKKNYKVQNSDYIDNISLAQFSNDPNTVRIVFNLKEGAPLNNFKVMTDNKNNIAIKYQNKIIDNSIQYKFYTINGDQDKSNKLHNTKATVEYPQGGDKFDLTPKIQTKFFLNKVNQNSSGIILKGIGSISLQQTIYKENEASVIMDSTLISTKLADKTYTIPQSSATLTIEKLGDKKAKLILKGENLKDYRFVISPDGQNLFICHRSFVINTEFSMHKAQIASYNAQKNSANYYIFDFNFTSPVSYNVFEQGGNFYLDINNLDDYKQPMFAQMAAKTDVAITALKISSDKTRYVIPMENLNFAYANVESNAKSIKLCFRQKSIIQKPKSEPDIVLENPSPTKETLTVIIPTKAEPHAPIPEIKIEQKVPKKGEAEVITKIDKKMKKTSISSMKKVVLDPGHGGNDCGAISAGVQEKNLNLTVALLVKENLEKKNIHVYMTRTKDNYLTLEERTTYSNETSPDIFVSIHTNSTVQESSFGLETHYFKDDSLDLAKTIHSHFASEDNIKNWATKDRGVLKSRFYVINHTEAPSVLIEMGFISNLTERSKLNTKKRQQEIANSITKGILEYLKVK